MKIKSYLIHFEFKQRISYFLKIFHINFKPNILKSVETIRLNLANWEPLYSKEIRKNKTNLRPEGYILDKKTKKV